MLELIKDLVDAYTYSSQEFYELLLLKYLRLANRDKGFIISVNQEDQPYIVTVSGIEEAAVDKLCDFYRENYYTIVKEFSDKEDEESFGINVHNGVILICFRCTFKGLLILLDPGKDNDREEIQKVSSFSGVAAKLIDLFNERLQLKNEIISHKEEIERKGLYLTSFAHELKTPVNAIAGFAQLLKEPDLKQENIQKYINIISDTSENLISIISYFNEIAEIESGNISAFYNVVNVPAIIESLFNKFYLKFKKKNIVLEKRISPEKDFPLVSTDEAKVRQVLNTLILNALNNTFTGSVKIACRLINESIEFSVVDTGTGMNPVRKSRIFDFQTLNSTDAINSEGSGLGLVIARSYIQVLGGSIWCESNEGTGTEFFFSIPYHPVSARMGISDYQTENKADTAITSKKRILVAEDDNLNFQIISYFLSNLNIEVLRALNGKEAVDIFKSVELDLILMDIRMPVMDGYEATKQIRESNSEIKIIAQTAYSNDKSYAVSIGCNDFIAKPFTRDQLLLIVSSYL